MQPLFLCADVCLGGLLLRGLVNACVFEWVACILVNARLSLVPALLGSKLKKGTECVLGA